MNLNLADTPAATKATIEHAIARIAAGEPVIVVDDEDRENEGDLIMAAASATPERIAFFLKHTSGLICVALPGEQLDRLGLPLMVDDNEESQGTAFTITVDSADGVTTGISAADRALTLRGLADPSAVPEDFVRPGHVLPLRAREGGVLRRAGHTEAALDLSRMAGAGEAGVLCEVVSADRESMANRAELERLAAENDLPIFSIAELIQYRLSSERLVEPVSSARIPTPHGDFVGHVWRSQLDGVEHMALVRGDVSGPDPVLVRVHSECLTGDIFGSRRCDCGQQLDDSLAQIAAADKGVLVYLRGHEGRGIGLGHKLRAYELQDRGADTVDANLELGLPVDSREYGVGAQILMELGVRRMRLMTNNPGKYTGLGGFGLEIVGRVPLPPRVTAENVRYLRTKQERMGHLTDLPVGDSEPVVDQGFGASDL